MAGHLGSFGRALAARARRRRLGNEGAFDEAADRLGSAGPVGLPFGPCVNALFKIAVEPESDWFANARRRSSPTAFFPVIGY